MAGDVIDALPHGLTLRSTSVARRTGRRWCATSWTAEPRHRCARTRRSRRSSRCCASNELPGVPVVDAEGRCVGHRHRGRPGPARRRGDLHIPHYINLFGGTVFLEPLGRFERRLRKAFASNGGGHDDRATPTRSPRTRACARPRASSTSPAQPAAGRGGRPAGRAWSPAWTCSAPWRRERGRARARHASTSARSSATARRAAAEPLCAVVKADGYGHGAVAAAEAALRRRRHLAGRGHRGRGRGAARAGIDAPILVMGALTREELRVALEADADVVAWTERASAAAAPRACT